MTKSREQKIIAVSLLVNRVVALASTELGNQAETKSKTRASYYHLTGNKIDTLERVYFEGRYGSKAPRPKFVEGKGSDHDDNAIKVAKGENAILVEDLVGKPPDGFTDPQGRSYVSFVSVPVRAGDRSFGMLTADSDMALSKVDKELLILMAGILGAGLAMLDEAGIASVVSKAQSSLTATTPPIPSQSQGISSPNAGSGTS